MKSISFNIQGGKTSPDDDIDVWLIPLDQVVQPEFFQNLKAPEQRTALKFSINRGYNQYVLCRYAVRKILAQYIGCELNDIQIGYRKQGKPFLEKPPCNLDFNISHSEKIALFAVSKHRRVGIDLEALKPLENIQELSSFIMSEQEYSDYKTLSNPRKLTTFYKIWVRKEAFLKGMGVGLHYPLKNISIWSISENHLTTSILPDLEDANKGWSFSDFSFHYKGEDYQASCFQEENIRALFYHFFLFSS